MNPHDLPAINRELKRCYDLHDAPIIELIQAQTNDPFKILVATILSARTKDETTTEVTTRLFPRVSNLTELLAISQEELEPLLHPVGFFRTKAKHLKAMAEMLRDQFDGTIPETIDELCLLPGVGRKTANLVVAVATDYLLASEDDLRRDSYSRSSLDLETHFGINERLHHDFFPASAHRGPWIPLLRHHPRQALDFFIHIFNYV